METATNTADLSNRTIAAPAPRDLPLPDLQRKEVDFTCAKHGAMKVEIFKVFHDWSTPKCPQCDIEGKRLMEEYQREQKEKEAQARKRTALENRLKRSCIPPRFQQKHFGNYQPTTPAATKILEKCQNYAERFPDFAQLGTGMILCGHAGTGKTHLACAMGNHIMHRHEKSAVYMQVSEAIRMVKETYGKAAERTEQQAINWFKGADLLILDEVGVQFGTDAERYIIFEIINGRYEDLKPTILISNLAADGLKEYAGERVIDRMKENGGMMMVFDWKSHRGSENLPTP